jgi:hypothetical protein
VLDTWCWVLGARYLVLGAGLVLVTWCWVLVTGYWVLGAGYLVLGSRTIALLFLILKSDAAKESNCFHRELR